jgi:hypothetical protein
MRKTQRIMKTTEYFKTLLDTKSSNSTKSFVLMLSAIISALVNLTICFVLIYDVTTNGYIKTSLSDAGFFILCTGGYMAGSGLTKALADRRRNKRGININEEIDEEK